MCSDIAIASFCAPCTGPSLVRALKDLVADTSAKAILERIEDLHVAEFEYYFRGKIRTFCAPYSLAPLSAACVRAGAALPRFHAAPHVRVS